MKRIFLITLMMVFAFMANAASPGNRDAQTHWTFNVYTQYNMTLTGIVNLDGESMVNNSRSAYLEVGAFCGEECRGSYLATLNPAPFAQGYYYLMQIYSDVQAGEAITFRIWDHETNAELDVTCASDITFTADDGLGNLMNPYVLTFTTNATPPTTAVISAIAEPEEGGSVDGAGTYEIGSSCTLTATANTGYTFENWTKNDTVVSTNATYSFTVTASADYVAHFSLNSYEITATASPTGAGTIDGAGTYNYGASCTLTATAIEGYTFVNWTKNDTVVSTNATYSFTVTASADYVAHFSLNSYEITATASPTGAGTIDGAGTYNYGASCTLTATAAEGYTFVNWTKNGEEVSTNPSFSFTVTEAAAYVANFNAIPQTVLISATAEPAEGGEVSGAGTYEIGSICTLTATANDGYTFVNWTKTSNVGPTPPEPPTTTHWTYNVYTQYNMTLTGIVNLDGESMVNNSRSAYLEVGAFCGEECRGSYLATLNPAPFAQGYYYQMQIYSDVQSGEAITFRVWDHEVNAELDVTCASNITFTADEGLGNLMSPYELTFVTNRHSSSINSVHTGSFRDTANGEVVSTDPIYSFTVTEDATYVAYFSLSAPDTVLISATAEPAEGGEVSGAGTYEIGSSCTLTATANEGYTFVNWTKDGEVVSTDASFSFTVTEDAVYVANFEINSYEITATTNPEGAGTITGANTYSYGSTCTLTVTPNEGYTFINWTKDGVEVSTNMSFSFTVTEDAAYVANFEINSYEITATTNPEGAGTIIGADTYSYGSTCTLTVTPNEGYTFINWTKDGEEVSTNMSFSFIVTEDAAYVANFSVNGYQITATTNPEGAGTITGAGPYEYGATCTLTVTANEGYTFINWTKDGVEVSTNMSFSFTVTEDAAYVANFSVNSYEITATAEPTGAGTIEGAGTYSYGTTCTLTATANEGYTFVNWTKDGEEVSANASFSFTVTEDAAYVANFSVNSYEITATVNPTEGGTVTGGGTYSYGATCTLTATAAEGYTFVNWTKDGEEVSTNASFSFTVTEDAAYVANFSINNYEITATANPTEGGTVTGSGTYSYGASCTLTATANEGYTFVNWTKDGEEVSTNASFNFTVTEDAAYVANFNVNSYEITATTNPTGAGTIDGANTYTYGATCTLTVTPNPGYTFVNWTKDGEEVSTSMSFTITVTEDAAYVANFSVDGYQITATTNPIGAGTITGAGAYTYGATCTLSVTANEGYTFVNWTKDGVEVTTNTSFSFTVTEDAAYVANFSVNSYEITATAEPTEAGTIDGAGTYSYGTTCTLTATANEGYTFVNWTKDGVEVSTNTSITFTVTEDAAYVANFSINSYEITATTNPTGAGTIEGANTYTYGATCTLSVTANEGYTFVNWTKDGVEVTTNTSFSFTVTEDAAYVANFSVNSYEITATAEPTEAGTIDGAGTYSYGTTCTLTATANEGYTFVNWTKDGVEVSTNTSITFTVTEDAAYVANFSVNNYEITATTNPTGAGTIDGANTYTYGATCTLTVTPNPGYTFVNWTKDGEEVSTSMSFTITVTEDAAYVANFSVDGYQITATTNPTGAGTIDGAGTYTYGATCMLTVTANEGYTFVNWTKDGVEVTTNTSFSFTVTEDAAYVANFSVNSYEITATANPTEAGTIEGAGTYSYGTTCTLTATANEGYTFVNWTKDGEEVSSEVTYTFTVTETAAYVANFQINSYEITAMTNPTGAGIISGAATYTYGATCTLSVLPNTGYTFVNWTKNGVEVSTEMSFEFTVTESATYVANFSVDSYSITVMANPADAGTVTGGGTYNYGTSITLTAMAEEGYTFVNWTKDGSVVSNSPNYTITVTEDATYVANFEISTYEITVTANPTTGGTVTGGGTYEYGQTCTLTATPAENYIFVNWSKNGVVVSTDATYSFTVIGSGNYVATFAANEFQINVSANPSNGGVVTGAGVYGYGTTATLTATANSGFAFVNWTRNGVVVSMNATYSFTVTESGNYVAHFSRDSYQITATANPTDGGTITGAGTYEYGQTCTLTATAAAGYTFVNWTKNGTMVSGNATYSFTVTENAAYVANFSLNMYTVAVSADPTAGGMVSGGGTFLYGENCTVSAMPNAGYIFTNWTKNGSVVSTDAMYTFTVTENANLIAHFSLDHYNITVSVDPEASGTATGGGSFTYGETCTLTATANTGYAFVNWTKNGTVVSSNATYSFTVTDNGDYVAHFAVARYTLTVLAEPVEGGSVYGGGIYDFGHVVTLRAIANEGYEFINWTKDGAVISTNANHSVVVREDAEYVAHFQVNAFEIKANTNPDNAGDIEGVGYYNYGEICTLTVTPHAEYEFICWTLNGQVVSEEESFSFVVTEAREYVAHLQTDGLVEQGGITVELYPNPAKRRLTIEASEPVNTLEIYNINGALVYRQNDCSDKVEINVETYASGTYMIRLTTDSTIEIRRFVKE